MLGIPMGKSDVTGANQNPNEVKQAADKSTSLRDALRDPKAFSDKDFEPDRIDFGDRDVKF
jgi:hypothetical protein